MWDYYEWPRLIFIGDEEDTAKLESFELHELTYLTEKIYNILILSRRMQLNVLWVESDFDLTPLFHDYDV